MNIYAVLLLAIVAAVVYLVAGTSPAASKAGELSRVTFFAALLVYLWHVIGSRVVGLPR